MIIGLDELDNHDLLREKKTSTDYHILFSTSAFRKIKLTIEKST